MEKKTGREMGKRMERGMRRNREKIEGEMGRERKMEGETG